MMDQHRTARPDSPDAAPTRPDGGWGTTMNAAFTWLTVLLLLGVTIGFPLAAIAYP